MNFRKAYEHLWEMANSTCPGDIDAYVRAAVLLSAFDQENRDPLTGALLDSYISEKIHHVRGWFQDLCGLGERAWNDDQRLRHLMRNDIGKLAGVISRDGFGLYNSGAAGARARVIPFALTQPTFAVNPTTNFERHT